MRCRRVVGEIGEAPPVAGEASRFRGSAPIGGHDSGRESVGTTVGNRRPLRMHGKEMRCAGNTGCHTGHRSGNDGSYECGAVSGRREDRERDRRCGRGDNPCWWSKNPPDGAAHLWGAIRAPPVADEAGKSPKRCLRQNTRGDFEEVPRLAATTVAGNRLARRWAIADPYGSVTRSATVSPPVR